MKAITIPRHGGAEVLTFTRDFPNPEPEGNEVIVEVAATSINQMDLLVRNGYPNRTLPLPHIPGGDVVGTVARVGASVRSITVGQRVLVYPLLSCGRCSLCKSGRRNLCANWQTVGIHHHGGYAEEVAVPAGNLIPLPDGLDFQRAATLPVAGLTAHHALASVGRLTSGELCVVWGAAGGVGSMAIQIARHLGARTVAIVGGPERKREAEENGADETIDRTGGSVAERLKELAPDGADLVFDSIGADTYATSLGMLKNGGRLLSCGILGGRETPLNIHMVYYHHLSIHGVFLGTIDDMKSVVELAARGIVVPRIGRVLPLEQAAEGHRMLEAGKEKGKIVVNVKE